MPTIKARVGSQNTVRVLSNASSPPTRLTSLIDINSNLKTQDGMILVWDLPTQTFIMTSVIDSSSTTIEGIAYFTNTEDSTLPTNGALVVSGGVGVGKNLNVGAGLSISGISTFASDLDINAAVDILNGLNVGEDLYVGNDLYVSGVSTFIGNATFRGGTIGIGDSVTDDINVGGEFVSNLVPNTDNAYDLGTTEQRWRDGKFSGLVTSTNLFVTGLSTFIGNQNLTGNLSITGFASVTEGLYYDIGDFDGPNGIAYFDNTGKLIGAASTESPIATSNYILTTEDVTNVPVWTSTIDGGVF
jgi:hypothetical protein